MTPARWRRDRPIGPKSHRRDPALDPRRAWRAARPLRGGRDRRAGDHWSLRLTAGRRL